MSEEKFSKSEPGISHPLTRCAVRLTDDGRIAIMAGDKCGIVLDEETGVITLYGSEIRLASGTIKVNGAKLSNDALESHTGPAPVGRQLRRIDKVRGE